MIAVTATITIPRTELEISYVRASGPGGQNVNKVSSKVMLRWNPTTSTSLPAEVRARFLAQNGPRLTTEGDLIITSQRYRDQPRNLEDCCAKLADLIRAATIRPKVRRATKPSRGAKERRLKAKKHQAAKKGARRTGMED